MRFGTDAPVVSDEHSEVDSSDISDRLARVEGELCRAAAKLPNGACAEALLLKDQRAPVLLDRADGRTSGLRGSIRIADDSGHGRVVVCVENGRESAAEGKRTAEVLIRRIRYRDCAERIVCALSPIVVMFCT